MPSRSNSKAARIEQRVKASPNVDEALWRALKHEFAPISDTYLRTLLRRFIPELPPLIEGIRTGTFEEAERTLRQLAAEYEHADAARRLECRVPVLEAKQRLRGLLSRPLDTERREIAEEVLLWVSTWLENPILFDGWLTIRRRLRDLHHISHTK